MASAAEDPQHTRLNPAPHDHGATRWDCDMREHHPQPPGRTTGYGLKALGGQDQDGSGAATRGGRT